ncbi:NAD(P)/FAD-dependent oxidoreductase [Flavobacterium reichenbachii]|uniref:Pyridine nucleotide-disulfide oxidoreductase n=1 Tax=Flavobacterium reichenbachii TaxID=362418 RepID=A0A085ZPN6_9FLAO|nr:NAD(P)/FAD-dependent oxidoreductase [Flavobacterium reichenbachii]KFF06400.1 pyridine nucleotide-disulfide oxidoreductase [Flavobacterium reichenbachii]OXB14619.1 pyridine nucleotide-disulfide oxidoreductase [Flavobacterium reichenbachii]
MTDNKKFEIIIIGGSYAGLSAAMSLGRALRSVLIIDSGFPCNRQTPHSHNFITQDGEKPDLIAAKAKAQVLKYKTVQFHSGFAILGKKTENGFTITTEAGEEFTAQKLIFATGVKDIMPEIKGFSECWGISVIHCPYCHGYEVKNEKTGILANGNFAFHYAQLIRNWTKDLTIFTNGKSTLTQEETDKITKYNIPIIEKEIAEVKHKNGNVEQIVFNDNSVFDLKAIYSRPSFEQHCKIPEMLGCELTEQGYMKVDAFQKTNIPDVFACGDNASPMRSVAGAVASGSMAGAVLNNLMTEEEFQ